MKYESVSQLKGSVSKNTAINPIAYEAFELYGNACKAMGVDWCQWHMALHLLI